MKMDKAEKKTERELARLERRIARLYREAEKELSADIKEYFRKFAELDKIHKGLIGTELNGRVWTEDDYKQWRLNQIARGENFEALRDLIAERVTKANEIAVAYINGSTPKIYAINHNYTASDIQKQLGINLGLTMLDEETIKRLMMERPDSMPYYPPEKALQRGIDLAYGKRQITASVTSSILQGKSIKAMADDLQRRIPEMSRASAVRSARTAMTGAQNAGKLAAGKKAEEMGIVSGKEWIAVVDGRTRHSHRRLDGEVVGMDEKFSNGLRFPGDPQGKPSEVYNCRCRLGEMVITEVKWNRSRKGRDPKTGKWTALTQEMYDDWREGRWG